MAGADLNVSTAQNHFVAPYLTSGLPNPNFTASALGTFTDTGATQSTNAIEFDIGGAVGDGTVLDVLDSQDGTNYVQLVRLYGGAPAQVVQGVSRYLKMLTQALPNGIAPVVQWGKATAPGATPGTTYWINGGNPTGPLSGGTLDGSAVTVGALSAGSTTTIASGTGAGITLASGTGGSIVATASTALSLTAGTSVSVNSTTSIGLNAGNGMSIAATLGNVVVTSTAGNASVDAAGTVTIGSATATGVTVGSTTSSATTSLLAQTTLTESVGAGGTINIGANAVAQTVNVGTGAAAVQARFGSSSGASGTAVLGGTLGIGIGVAAPGSTSTMVDAPGAGSLTLGAANATSTAVGNAGAGHSTTILAGAGAGGGIVLAAGLKSSYVVANLISLGTSTVIGTAAMTVDLYPAVEVSATAGSLTFTLPTPADTTRPHQFTVINSGSNAYTMYGKSITTSATPQTASGTFWWSPTAAAWVVS
jgi:hypothetical protein